MLLNFILIISVLLRCSTFGSNEQDQKCDGGSCEHITRCPTVLKDMKNGISPKICGSESSVCCPDPQELISTTRLLHNDNENTHGVHFHHDRPKIPIHKKKCYEYATKTCDGVLKLAPIETEWEKHHYPRSENDHKTFPHTALIGYGEPSEIHWKCSGSLITEFHILTVARCEYKKVGYARWARLGVEASSNPIYEIIHRIIHPNYHYPSLQDDVAIFKLNDKIQFNVHVHPICLYNEEEIEQKKLFSVGFGRENCVDSKCESIESFERDKLQTNLMKKKLSQLQDIFNCVDLFKDHQELEDGLNPESTICVHLPESFKDECQGTLGDALLYKIEIGCPNFYSLTGISSLVGHWPNDYGCDFLNTSIIYTKVNHYIPWIEEMVWK